MKCYLCGKPAKISKQGRDICNNCFSRLFEKRIRKNVRINKIFNKNEKVLVIGNVNKDLVKRIIGKRDVDLTFRTKVNNDLVKKVDKVLIEWTADDEANEFLLNLFKGLKVKKLGKKFVKFLITMTDDDVIQFAKINKLKFKVLKKDKDIMKLTDALAKKHPNTKYTLLKNIDDLRKIGIKI